MESFEQRQNPIEPQPILADCNFDDLGIEMGEVYEATIAYQYPLVPADEDETWFFGGEYTVSVQTGDVVVNARSGGFAGLPTRLTHSFHALKSDVYGDSVSVQVPKLDLFNPLSAPSFSVVLHDPSGEVIQIGEALGFDAAHWTSSSVKAVWVPWDGSICQVRGSLVYGPAGD